MTKEETIAALLVALSESITLLREMEDEMNEIDQVNPIYTHKIEQLEQLLNLAKHSCTKNHPCY